MVEPEQLCPEPEPILSSETAGSILGSARKDWELTVEEVAQNLNLSVDTINALERDEYDRLPGYTFVKGYIRSYANLLRLDAENIIARVDLEPERLSEIPTSKGALKLKSKTQGKSKSKTDIVFKSIIFILILAGLALFGLNQLSKLDTDKLAEILKFPKSEKSNDAQNNNNEILFPPTDESNGSDPKEALIRIE